MEAADKRQSGHLNSARSGHLNLTATAFRSLGKYGRVLRE
jgi:hypothetical protein